MFRTILSGKAEFFSLRFGFSFTINKDSRIRSEIRLLSEATIENWSGVKLWFKLSQWDLMADWGGFVRGWPVRAPKIFFDYSQI